MFSLKGRASIKDSLPLGVLGVFYSKEAGEINNKNRLGKRCGDRSCQYDWHRRLYDSGVSINGNQEYLEYY